MLMRELLRNAAYYVSDPPPDFEELRPFVVTALMGSDPETLTGYGCWSVAREAANRFRGVLKAPKGRS